MNGRSVPVPVRIRTFTTKQSPCGPHETTWENVWSSSILRGINETWDGEEGKEEVLV